MDQIASKVNGKFSKLVVIKGAPGGGKTTLSWELCRRWANGEGWTDYSLVVLLRLRDENVHEAVELVDLFQCGDTDVSKSVHTIIRKNQGQDVLFILEGLDELPPSLRQKYSIFMKLITGCLLPASTVLVTTRPWAVCNLPVTCSSRLDQFIEILGFSSKQIQEYIDLMIKDGAPPELRKYIDSNPRISSAMYNPLHARIVVEVYRENHENSNSCTIRTTTEPEVDKKSKSIFPIYIVFCLTKLSDDWTKCILPAPRVRSSDNELVIYLNREHILWLYETQNKQLISSFDNVVLPIKLIQSQPDPLYFFALGYCIAVGKFMLEIKVRFANKMEDQNHLHFMAGLKRDKCSSQIKFLDILWGKHPFPDSLYKLFNYGKIILSFEGQCLVEGSTVLLISFAYII